MRLYQVYFYSILMLLLTACTKEEERAPLLPEPVIHLPEDQVIFQTKVGRALTITPTYDHVDESTTYQWTTNGSVIGSEPTLNFTTQQEGRYYVMLTVSHAGGSTEQELRIDVFKLDIPTIQLADAEQGYKVLQGSELVLTPVVDSFLPTTYSWQIDGKEVSNDLTLTLPTQETGTYQVRFATQNEDGQDEKTFQVEVCSPQQIEFSWHFLQTTYHLSVGRNLLLRPVDIQHSQEARYTWTVNNEVKQQDTRESYVFTAEKEGEYTVKVEMRNAYLIASQKLTVQVCPPEGTYQRKITGSSRPALHKIYEFLPAPGQFVNENYTATTMEEACRYAEERIRQTAYVSLGGFGGYLIAGFDHSIVNDGNYNIAITGNAFDGSSEPGIVWVMQDENGDGLPNDTWYELAGSEHGKPETWHDYAVTYYRPSAPQSSVSWTDNHGQRGSIDYQGAFHRQDFYYPAWVKEDHYTLRGTRLKERNYDQSGNGTYWVNDSYDWGYADNFSLTDRLTDDSNQQARPADNHFKISDAVDFKGKKIHLKYIDFVKIQVGVNSKSGWLGEISTEVFGIKDFNMLK